MVNRMFFTTLYIGEELNAYKIFETLNARGIKLSSADLLKNYLFSRMDDRGDTPNNIVDEWDEKWEKILSSKISKRLFLGKRTLERFMGRYRAY